MSDENIHIGKLLKQIVGYWKIYIPIGIACLIGGIVYILITPNEYEITARMQLLGKQEGMISEVKMLKSSGIGGLLGGGGSGGINAKDAILIMTSRQNLTEVIKQTNYQLETTTRKGLQTMVIDNDNLPVQCTFPESFLDTLHAPISIKFQLKNNIIEKAIFKSSLFESVEVENRNIPCDITLPIGKIIFNKNNSENGTFTLTVSPIQKVYESIVKEINLYPSETISDILILSSRSNDTQRTSKLLNAMMARYNDYSKIVKLNEVNLNAEFVKNRLDSVSMELAVIEHKIEIYKQTNKMPDPGAHGSITYYGSKEAEKQILEMETRMRMLNYVIEYMKTPSNTYSAIPIVDGAGEKAIAIYNQLILDRQRLLQSSEHNNPILQLADNQIKEQRKILIESVESVRKSLHISLDALYKKDIILNEQVDKLPTQEREYIEMLRQQKIKESMYLFLMQKTQEKELANSPDELAARIIDSAYASYQPVFPKKTIVLGVALLIACILSLITISIRMFAFNKKIEG